jgi:DNA-binding transcriptional LysR family regulator
MIETADVTVFVHAIRQGSLSAAGRWLGLTPVAASRRLAALEQELGVRLVNRTTRSLSLTPEGEAFLPHAEAMLDHAEEGRAAAAPDGAEASGVLRIAASVPFGRKVVTPMLALFLGMHPRLRVELRLSDALVDIAGEGIDIALRLGELRENGLVARRLADNPRRLYAAPAYLAAHGTPTSLDDLQHHECLSMPATTHWTFESNGRSVRQAIKGRFVADSVEALHQASVSGLGIVGLSEWNVREEVANGRLTPVVLADGTLADQGIWAVLASRRHQPAKLRLFLEAFGTYLTEFGQTLRSDPCQTPSRLENPRSPIGPSSTQPL